MVRTRRADRPQALAADTGAQRIAADLTDPEDVARVAEHVKQTGGASSLVNVAGDALGVDPVEHGTPEVRAAHARDQRADDAATDPSAPARAARRWRWRRRQASRIRVIEIAPGMVRREEFSLNRLGDAAAAEAVYAGAEEPLVAEDVADAIVWTLTRPSHVNIDSTIIQPRGQASDTLVARGRS